MLLHINYCATKWNLSPSISLDLEKWCTGCGWKNLQLPPAPPLQALGREIKLRYLRTLRLFCNQTRTKCSHLYKAAYLHPDTSGPNHPETDVFTPFSHKGAEKIVWKFKKTKCHLPWSEKKSGKCSPLSDKMSWGRRQTRNTIRALMLWCKHTHEQIIIDTVALKAVMVHSGVVRNTWDHILIIWYVQVLLQDQLLDSWVSF